MDVSKKDKSSEFRNQKASKTIQNNTTQTLTNK